MTKFETFLIEKGYKKYVYDFKTKSLKETNKHIISTMVNLDHRYIHPENPELEIIFGLHEAGKPPTLIYPRPEVRIKQKGYFDKTLCDDDAMNDILQKTDFEFILRSLTDRSIVYNLYRD